jgi:hypothetical protein
MHQAPEAGPVEEPEAFQMLRRFSTSIEAEGAHAFSRLSQQEFDKLADVLVIIEVHEAFENFAIRYMGATVVEAYGIDLTGWLFEDLLQSAVIRSCLFEYRDCALRGVSSIQRARPVAGRGDGLRFSRLLVPFVQDGGVTHVLGAFHFFER